MFSVGQFQSFTSKSGVLSARQAQRDVLIHSAIDPIAEARIIAAKIAVEGTTAVTVIGCGLGYLERELQAHGIAVIAAEVHADLHALRVTLSTGVSKLNSDKGVLLCKSASELRLLLAAENKHHAIYISPFVSTLIDELPSDIATELLAFKVLKASRALYQPLIAENVLKNADVLRKLPRLTTSGRSCSRIALAVGAGPSLNTCIEPIKSNRDGLLIIAASGAVPVLRANGISPDWTIALEARADLAKDIDQLEDGARVVVFPWSLPESLDSSRLDLYLADEQTGLETSGGTSSLTAADFAFKITRGNVYLLGMDLSDANGAYAEGALRVNTQNRGESPKFASMRAAIENWLRNHREHRVFQVVYENVTPLKGVRVISPERFAEDVAISNLLPTNHD